MIPQTDNPTLPERIERLERQNLRLKKIGVAVALIVGAVIGMGQSSSRTTPKTIEANEFILRDTNGKVRARLSLNEKDLVSQFVLLDRDGTQKVSLDSGYSGISGASLSLEDRHGKEAASLSVALDDFGGLLTLNTSDEKKKTTMTTSTILATDSDRTLVLTPQQVAFTDDLRNGNQKRPMILNRDRLLLTDAAGFATDIGVTHLVQPNTGKTLDTSAASVVLFDKDGKVIWKTP